MAVAEALRACADAVESLAQTAASLRTSAPTAPADEWPALMSTSIAARYCGYKTTGGLRKAHFDGKVFPTGRRGGVGPWTWARVDLDAFLRGGVPAHVQEDPPATEPPPAPRPVPQPPAAKGQRRAKTSRRNSPHVEEALRRLREIARKPPR
jgi:hypothetical protein